MFSGHAASLDSTIGDMRNASFERSSLTIDRHRAMPDATAYANILRPSRMAKTERQVRLFRNGHNQALRIPREFELEGDEVTLRKEGNHLIVEPVRKDRLVALLGTLEFLHEHFPDMDEKLGPLDEVAL